MAASLYFILPSTQVNICHSTHPPTRPFFRVISAHPTTHPSISHYFICTGYYNGAGQESAFFFFFFSLTVQKTKCSWGWQPAGQIGAGKWHLVFITASREWAAPRCALDPPVGSLHGGNQRRSDFRQKTPRCSASFLALIRLQPPPLALKQTH